MAAKKDKITWVTCPDCGSKIGIVISVGKGEATQVVHEHAPEWPPSDQSQDARSRLQAAGIDVELLDIEEGEEVVSVSPKRFLGDQWNPINESMRAIGGTWIRDGRNSRWELPK